MASKPRPDKTIRKCKHCGWTYIESCDCRRGYKPHRRRPTDSERLTWLLGGGLVGWGRRVAFFNIDRPTRRDFDRLMREQKHGR